MDMMEEIEKLIRMCAEERVKEQCCEDDECDLSELDISELNVNQVAMMNYTIQVLERIERIIEKSKE